MGRLYSIFGHCKAKITCIVGVQYSIMSFQLMNKNLNPARWSTTRGCRARNVVFSRC